MELVKKSFGTFKAFYREYIIINVLYYGLIVSGMIVSALNPGVQKSVLTLFKGSFTSGLLGVVEGAYSGRHILPAIVLTFVVNLFIGSIICITMPSLVPVAGSAIGLLIGMYRAVLWGFAFSPIIPQMQLPMLPHWPLIIIEGQAYVMVMLAAVILAKTTLFPGKAGVRGHASGYVYGLKSTGLIYLAVFATLAVAAVYEALEVILIVPKLM